MADYQVSSPVLITAFNRPWQFRRVLQRVLAANPPRLYIAIDGPRAGVETDLANVMEVRELAKESPHLITRTLFAEENLGCRLGVQTGITWFFSEEEEGIILEDDCLPSLDFFRFMDFALDRFRSSDEVGHISGFRPGILAKLPPVTLQNEIPLVWGWATWRRNWISGIGQEKDLFLKMSADMESRLSQLKRKQRHRLLELIQKSIEGEIDSWDYGWALRLWSTNQSCLLPPTNLIENIGFGGAATHTLRFQTAVPPGAVSDQQISSLPISDSATDRALMFWTLGSSNRVLRALVSLVKTVSDGRVLSHFFRP